jgi:3-hydroxybutyryl-CoA dehydrogenase
MTVFLCGAGTMGRGIAIACVSAGHTVRMYDVRADAAQSAVAYVAEQLRKNVEKGRMTQEACDAASARCTAASALQDAADADLVIEAIAEVLEIKHAFFREMESVVRAECILASNTSSISITALARCLQLPQRFVGLHFFNPAHIMKLVEVIRGAVTSDDTVTAALSFAKGLGKTAVTAADVPGFIVNRVARNFYNEAQRVVMERAASVEQVDTLMKGIGFKMGPFELMDLIGVDVNLDVTKSQWEQFFYETRFTPSMLQQQLVDAGLHGRKSGRGFYDHTKD